MRAICVALGVVWGVAGGALADTILDGPFLPGGVYTAAAGPYICNTDLTIQPGVSVVIQAGAVFRMGCEDLNQAGGFPSRVEFTVQGSLTVQGTPNNPVVFEANPNCAGFPGVWQGILFSTTSALNISNLKVANAQTGVQVSGTPQASFACSGLTLDTCNTGLLITSSSGSYTINALTATNCTTGVSSSAPSLGLDNAYLGGNQTGYQLTSAGNGSLRNATIIANSQFGVRHASSGALSIINSIVANNPGTGLARTGSASFLFTDGLEWGNGTLYSNVAPGSNIMHADPKFEPGLSPRLRTGSAAIDAANPFFAPNTDLFGTARPFDGNFDGTARSDLGAVEFTCAPAPGFVAQPTPQAAAIGQPFTFSATPVAGTLTYQWRLNGVPILNVRGVTGADTPTLHVEAAGSWDAGSYTLTVTNSCGSSVSQPVTLTLLPACGSQDFNGDGDFGTDADIEAFFRVLGGGGC